MFQKWVLACFLLPAFLASTDVVAESYWGGGLGKASFSLKNFGTLGVEDGTAFRLFAGSRDSNFGMEGELTGAEYDWDGSGGLASHFVSNLAFSGVAYHTISNGFDLYGKLGLNLWGVHYEVLGASSDTENGLGIALGVGLDIAATEQFHIRLEYQMLPGIDDGTDEGDVTQMTVNGAYFF